ncbi:hypothetical protein C8Q74DRAFT_506794 [Fomes fomentarius]|nr:hypothetical protein C8Q74DRAFT_506794 [Fomes fomentarius]
MLSCTAGTGSLRKSTRERRPRRPHRKPRVYEHSKLSSDVRIPYDGLLYAAPGPNLVTHTHSFNPSIPSIHPTHPQILCTSMRGARERRERSSSAHPQLLRCGVAVGWTDLLFSISAGLRCLRKRMRAISDTRYIARRLREDGHHRRHPPSDPRAIPSSRSRRSAGSSSRSPSTSRAAPCIWVEGWKGWKGGRFICQLPERDHGVKSRVHYPHEHGHRSGRRRQLTLEALIRGCTARNSPAHPLTRSFTYGTWPDLIPIA